MLILWVKLPKQIDVSAAIKLLENTEAYFKNFRDIGFESSKKTAGELGIQLDLHETKMTFKEKRVRTKKRHFDDDDDMGNPVPESAEVGWKKIVSRN